MIFILADNCKIGSVYLFWLYVVVMLVMNYCEKASTIEPPLTTTHLQRPFFWQTVHTFALVSTCLHWPLSSAPKVTLVRWGSTECELFAIAFNPQRAPSVGGKTKCNKLEERTRVFWVIFLIVLGLIVVIERDALSLTLSLSSFHTVSLQGVDLRFLRQLCQYVVDL